MGEDFAGKQFEPCSVNGRTKVNSVRETLDAQGGIGTQAEGLPGSLALQLQLRKPAGILARVGLILLNEFLGKVVDNNLIQGRSTQFIIVRGCQDGVHATTAGDNRDIRSGMTKVRHHNQLIRYDGLRSGIVGQSSSNRLMDELDNLKTSSIGRGDQSITLSILEVGGDSNNGGINILSNKLNGGVLQTAEMAGGDIGYSDRVWVLASSVPD